MQVNSMLCLQVNVERIPSKQVGVLIYHVTASALVYRDFT